MVFDYTIKDIQKLAPLRFKTVIAKAANLVKYVRKSIKASEILEEEKDWKLIKHHSMEFPIDNDSLSSWGTWRKT